VSRSVDLGYRVVDEYIRQGQRAARRMAERSYGPQAIAGDMQELTARMFQYASDFAGVWFQMMGLASTGELGRMPFRWGAPPAGAEPPRAAPEPRPVDGREPSGPGTDARTHVAIEVQSTRPAEVTIDLRPESRGRSLLVHELRAVAAEKPRLTAVALRNGTGEGPPRFRIRVPDDHPEGVFSGLIIDEETSVPAGTLCVRIGGPSAAQEA
jgi:hypothetical protein